MIVVLKSDTSEAQLQHILAAVEALGFKTHVSRGTYRTIVGLIGDERKTTPEALRSIPGVADAIPVMPPYKLASKDAHPQPSIVNVAGVKIGGGNLAMIAGPCSVEEPERMDNIAKAVRAAGANIFRGGAYKPRTSPYAFQGLGVEGLKILRDTGKKHGMPVVTEVTDTRNVEVVAEYSDMIQVGARNMQNFALLLEIGLTKKPVLLKRGMSATVEDLLMSAEYILSQGDNDVVLCERGIKGFDKHTRNLYDIASVAVVKGLSHLPIIVDPSHATGKPDLIPPCALAGIAVGADGVHIEVHDCPEKAKSDGPQALLPNQYAELCDQIRKLAALFNKQISPLPGA